jgi:hypothetical protein
VRYLLVGLIIVLGMVGCIPPKGDVYPTIQANQSVYVNTTSRSVGAVPTSTPTPTPTFPAPPEIRQTPDFIIPPSAPNPYLNQTQYRSLESYFPAPPNNHYTPWIGGWYNYYQAPVVSPTPIVFWTGSAEVTVE